MLVKQDIVCLSITDYGYDIPVGKDHLMEIFAKNGNKVLMFNVVGTRAPQVTKYDLLKTVRKIKEWFSGYRIVNDIIVINPFRLPFIKYKIVNKLNELVLWLYFKYYFRKFKVNKPIFWSLNVLYADLLKKIKKTALLYYVSDEYSLFSGNDRKTFEAYEKKLLSYADGAITVSRSLYREKSKYNKNVISILNATNPYHFIRTNEKFVPCDMKSLNKPIVGFSGKIEDWVDLDLIKMCALRYPKYSFVLIGPVKGDISIIKNISNVYLLGKKSYNELPQYLNNFDISILPFILSKRMKTVDIPLTLQEYFATAKPIIAININIIDKYSDAYTLVSTKEEFVREIGCALEKDNKELRARRRQIALDNSWQRRAEELSNWIENTILNKKL